MAYNIWTNYVEGVSQSTETVFIWWSQLQYSHSCWRCCHHLLELAQKHIIGSCIPVVTNQSSKLFPCFGIHCKEQLVLIVTLFLNWIYLSCWNNNADKSQNSSLHFTGFPETLLSELLTQCVQVMLWSLYRWVPFLKRQNGAVTPLSKSDNLFLRYSVW